MINLVLQNTVRFVFLVLLQGLILNQVQLFGFMSPYLYVLFILLLPVEMNRSLVLGLAFLLGLCVDLFSNSWGMHLSACLFLAYVRPFVLRLMAPRDGYEFGSRPGVQELGISWFVSYAFILILLHHFFLFIVEVFRWSEVFSASGRAFSSALFTLLLAIISQYLSYQNKSIE